MNPVDAIRLQARHYPGGVDALAVLLGKSGETLRKEIAGASGYKLGVHDACAISEACIAIGSPHCNAFANAVAVNCGGFVELRVAEVGAPKRLSSDTAALLKETSDIVTKVAEALADGVVSDNERRDLDRELQEAIEALQRVQADVGAAHEVGRNLRAVS